MAMGEANLAVGQTAGPHSLTAAGQRERLGTSERSEHGDARG